MSENSPQTVLNFIKEIWFQLNSRFDLENTEAFKLLKPYLIELQENSFYTVTFLTFLFLVPYTFIKIRRLSRDRERKLDELMEEMEEEEFDEDDPRRLRRPDINVDTERSYPEKEEKDSSTYKKVLEEIKETADSNESSDEFQLEPHQLFDAKNTIELEENFEPVSTQLTENEFNEDLNKQMSAVKNIELHINENDEAVKEVHEDEELNELEKHDSEIDPFENYFKPDEAITELHEDEELNELPENHSENDPLGSFLALDEDAQDKVIKDLQDEKDQTNNQLAEQIEEPEEADDSIKSLSQNNFDDDITIDDEYDHEDDTFLKDLSAPENLLSDTQDQQSLKQDQQSPSDSEVLSSLEPKLENIPELDEKPKFETDQIVEPVKPPKIDDYESKTSSMKFEEDLDFSSENFTFKAESMSIDETIGSDIDTNLSSLSNSVAPSEGSDSLIDRLKFLQTRFENRYQPSEQPPESPSAPTQKSIPKNEYERFKESRRYSSAALPPDSKKYMDLLESFVFMKNQKKQ